METFTWTNNHPLETRLIIPSVHDIRTEPGAVYIGRGVRGHRESEWANPFKIAAEAERLGAIRQYWHHVLNAPERTRLPELAGQRLACWCSPKPCHGHVLRHLIAYQRFHRAPCPACRQPVESFLNDHDRSPALFETWTCWPCRLRGMIERPGFEEIRYT